MMTGKTKAIIIVAFMLLLAAIIPHRKIQLISLPDRSIAQGFELHATAISYLLEPLLGTSDYFLSFNRAKEQLTSWVIWIIIFCFLFAYLKKDNRKFLNKALSISANTFLWFLGFLTYALFFYSGEYTLLKKTPSNLAVDLHSHSVYSHDGMVNLQESMKNHKKNGFDLFFITDHNRNIYKMGEEISDKNNNHLLILGLTESISAYSAGKKTQEITEYTHKNNGALIVAHWWQEQGSPLEELSKAGVDGFEIYGHEKKPLSQQTQDSILEFCRLKHLAAVGGSNWHGWGNRNDVWTIFTTDNTTSHTSEELISSLRKRQTEKFNVLFIKPPERSTLLILLEPFSGLAGYFLTLNFYQRLSWLFWIVLVYFVLLKIRLRVIQPYIYFFAGILLFILSVSFYIKWLPVSEYNTLLLKLTKTYFILSGIFVYLGIKKLRFLVTNHIST